MKPSGLGRKKILVVAEAPGNKEDSKGTQLIGDSGQRLRRTLNRIGLDLDKDCWKTNAIICRPPNNETPDSKQIECCRPNLIQTIEKLKPNVVILLGEVALESLLATQWLGELGEMTKWAGWCIPSHQPNVWVVPTFHPSYLLRKQSPVLDKMFRRHLKRAVSKCKTRPWGIVPNFKNHVDIIYRPYKAAKILNMMREKGGCVAFDYETNCLKPDKKKAQIISCSVCWNGKKTIAFPWERETIEATSELLKSPLLKIASNLKFENRWTKKFLGHYVNNWWLDTMIASHVLDNRKGITSIKFQSFIHLGVKTYDKHIKPFLNSTKTGYNRIHQLHTEDLLLYNGLDSLLEYLVAMKQYRMFKKRDERRIE
jgi:DNA polymerase